MPQRIRVAHGSGEIELLVQVVDSAETAARLAVGDDDDTNLHQIKDPGPSQDFAAQSSQPRGLVLARGERIGKYELKEKLGQGTFGIVFVARDTDLDRDVAIKILNPSHQTNADILHRFLQEARASARIAHPGIVTVLDCGKIEATTGDSAYIVLELLQGESLTSRLARSGKLAPATAVELARQIASALDAAHRADVLHRDLKPDNVHLVPDPAVPSGERVKVLDFGLARIGGIGASHHTQVNTVFGTPRYMSPEQCRSATMIDERSDIYSLGCILFELLTGRTPFDGDVLRLLNSHQRVIAPRTHEFSPEIPHTLDDLIAAMLAKDPDKRPQSMAALETILQDHGAVSPGVAPTMMPIGAHPIRLSDPTHPAASTVLPDPAPWHPAAPRKKRKGVIVACLAFCIAAAVTAVIAQGHSKSASANPVRPLPTITMPISPP